MTDRFYSFKLIKFYFGKTKNDVNCTGFFRILSHYDGLSIYDYNVKYNNITSYFYI